MTLPIAIAIVLLTIAVGSAAYILVARRSPEGGRGERTPTSVYADTPGSITSRAMELTLERMTQNPIGDLPLPVCPPRS